MKLHPKLEQFKTTKNIKQFNKLLTYVENDLKGAGVVNFEVEIWEKERATSSIKRMLTLEDGTEAHQIMFVSGVYQAREFSMAIPLRNSRTMPYNVYMDLPVQVNFVANFVRALVGGKWKVTEGPEGIKERLKAFEMPKVAWKHSAGGYKFNVVSGATIGPSEDDPSHTVWSIQSGYQGAIVNVGPRCAQYLESIQQLETVLSNA